uniref:EGF-like domain-containing protein n=1 Tax=Ascaris lumbricoides TaxID=6252 RepID=A0A0M3HQA3_ASCLU
MRQFKTDFDQLDRESHALTSARSTSGALTSLKTLQPSDETPAPQNFLKRPVSQAVINTPLSIPINTEPDLKSADNMKAKPTQKPDIAACSNNPCMNGGTCLKDRRKQDGFRCDCAVGWTGKKCDEMDHCLNHECVSGECINNSDNYTCECLPNFAGQFCTRDCGIDFCKRNGTCIEKRGGELACECPPGSAGKHCEREINECNFRRCKNAIKCIDKWNDYECICEPGWMGKNCDRPCQDIYGSCKLWKRQGQCELMRDHTNFFDSNCALSCGQCEFINSTIRSTRPMPSALLPLAWMLGIWRTDVNGTRNRVIDYPLDFRSNGYEETLMISLEVPLMFGTPSINFTSIAISKTDPEDQHVLQGFVTIRNRPDEAQLVALSSVSNLGVMMIEEGELHGSSVTLKPRYRVTHPLIHDVMPKDMSRSFLKNGEKLLQSVSKKNADGKNEHISKHYKKIVHIEYL